MRILHILPVLPSGGVGGYIKNIISKIDLAQYDTEVLIATELKKDSLLTFLKEHGIVAHFVSAISLKKTFSLFKEFKEFFIKNKYDIVEIHASNMAFMCAKYASKIAGAKVVLHEHSTLYSFSKLKSVRNYLLTKAAKKHVDCYIACGEKVAERKFYSQGISPSNVFIMPNPIIMPSIQNLDLRNQLDLGDKKICIAVGYLTEVKNHQYLLDVFKMLSDESCDIHLLIAGDGELAGAYNRFVDENALSNVSLLGYRTDIPDLLNACDLLLMPSKFEGLPVTVLEAQSFGLPCILSDNITKEMVVNDNVVFLPIEEQAKPHWCSEIKKMSKLGKVDNTMFAESKYNLDNSIVELEKIYTEIASCGSICNKN